LKRRQKNSDARPANTVIETVRQGKHAHDTPRETEKHTELENDTAEHDITAL
jgi:hypothetical protein